MSQLPVNPPSPKQQQKLMEQMYLLMGQQVQSYHKHRHMGNNSSVTTELAQELMASIEYTVHQAGGMYAHSNVADTLRLGQTILEEKVNKAKALLVFVDHTAPHWQTECRWEALRYLRHFLEHYDSLHLAHKGPENLYYPILIAPPEGIQGIDSCLFYLNILWIENQIMAGVPDDVLDSFWDRLPTDTQNQCEQLLINGIGKTLLAANLDTLTFSSEEHMQLIAALTTATEELLHTAAKRLCQRLNLKDENACMYVEAIIPMLTMWTGENAQSIYLSNLFV